MVGEYEVDGVREGVGNGWPAVKRPPAVLSLDLKLAPASTCVPSSVRAAKRTLSLPAFGLLYHVAPESVEMAMVPGESFQRTTFVASADTPTKQK